MAEIHERFPVGSNVRYLGDDPFAFDYDGLVVGGTYEVIEHRNMPFGENIVVLDVEGEKWAISDIESMFLHKNDSSFEPA